jgi:hypothetical protein
MKALRHAPQGQALSIDYWVFHLISQISYLGKKTVPLYLDEGAHLNRKKPLFLAMKSCNSMRAKEIKILEIFYFCF